MELSNEFIESNGLNEEQVNAIKSVYSDTIANEKKTIEEEFRGLANKNAEGILEGVASGVESLTGIKRNKGERFADYLAKARDDYMSKQEEPKSSSDDIESIKAKYESEKNELLQKLADYDEIKEKATKADDLSVKLTSMQREVAFNTVKPNFHEDVNKYEADYKFSEWKRNFLEKYDLEMSEDMIPMYVDKENKFKTGKVEDLIKQDKTLQELTMGRQQKGTGSRQQEIENVEGVPFSIPKDADSKQISKSIKEYLATKNMMPTSPGYSAKFKELQQKIRQKTAA